MSTDELRIVVLTGGSRLCLPFMEQVSEHPRLNVVGIVYDTETLHPGRGLVEKARRLLRYHGFRGAIGYFISRRLRAWRPGRHARAGEDYLRSLRNFAGRCSVPLHVVDDINSPAALDVVRSTEADLYVVIGTRILKGDILRECPGRMINVHQALTPFYRGGACTFWALYNGERASGVTIHEVVADVDAGAVILQERIPLEYDYRQYGVRFEEFFETYQGQLDVLAVRLLVRAAALIADGRDSPRPIDISRGKRCRRPTHREKQELRRILRRRFGG